MTTMDAIDLSNSFKHFSMKESSSGTCFNRTDGEIIALCHNKNFRDKIKEVDIYSKSPQILTEIYRPTGTKGWYFLTRITPKYPNARRPNRLAGDGFWNPTSCTQAVRHNREIVGTKQSFKFCRGKPGWKGESTQWMMDEYNLNGSDIVDFGKPVLCRIYKKGLKGFRDREREVVQKRSRSEIVTMIRNNGVNNLDRTVNRLNNLDSTMNRLNDLDGMMNKLNIGAAA